jgi:2-methylisocitrate lyase-like PEP mutase family enzyme
MPRRFPPPWTIEALDGGFKIVDAKGQAVAYVYGHADPREAEIANALTLDEARRIASNIAKLPVLLGQARPDDSLKAGTDAKKGR